MGFKRVQTIDTVSYTHLDVYKRQILYAQTDLNWEKESVKLLTIIKNVLAS